MLMNVHESGCFSIFRRADDVTRTISTGGWGVGGVLRPGSRIQKGGGVSYIQKGGFRTGISGADPNCCRALGKSTSKKIADSRRGGFPITPKKSLYPRLVLVNVFTHPSGNPVCAPVL